MILELVLVACGTMMICCQVWGYNLHELDLLPVGFKKSGSVLVMVTVDDESWNCGSRLQDVSRDWILGEVGAQDCRLPLQHHLSTLVSSYRETGPREHWKPKPASHLDRQRSKSGYKLERCDALPDPTQLQLEPITCSNCELHALHSGFVLHL
jgi:hypothetical protein